MVSDFQRARSDAQKEQRRAAILQAAAALLDEGSLEAVGLNAIARRAGIAKSNVYRYFES
ncbi:MAG: TetR family transcriptional regulator, partial [Myxococcales bacterium]|nr:TetR family transcriptional regulator [Myxococcales bacterium]